MINNSLQGDLQEAIRNALNCANSYEGDLYALCNLYGVADGAVSGRLIPVAQKHSPTIGTASGALNYLLQNPTVLPSLGLNFVDGTDRLDSRVTFTRASNAWRFNSAGVLTQATTNTPRFDYNPSTLAPLGLLIEEQRTNSIRNNTMVGAVAGTPGTLPTNWSTSIATTTGLTTSVVEVGFESGISYVDVRLSGTASGAGTWIVQFESNGVIAASVGQTWAGSAYWKLQSGTFTGLSGGAFRIDERAGGFLATQTLVSATPTSSALASQRISGSATLANASTTNIAPYLRFIIANGAAIDITLRIGLPQLELGAFATSVIPTSGAAATRAADVAVMTGSNFSSWYNQTEGTLFSDFSFAAVYATAPSAAFSVDDGTSNNLIILRTNTAHTQYGATATINATNLTNVNSVALGSTSANASLKEAIAYKSGDSMLCGAGTLGTASTTTFSGASFTAARIGNNFANNQPLNGWVRRIAYYPRRLSNSELQAITS